MDRCSYRVALDSAYAQPNKRSLTTMDRYLSYICKNSKLYSLPCVLVKIYRHAWVNAYIHSIQQYAYMSEGQTDWQTFTVSQQETEAHGM